MEKKFNFIIELLHGTHCLHSVFIECTADKVLETVKEVWESREKITPYTCIDNLQIINVDVRKEISEYNFRKSQRSVKK